MAPNATKPSDPSAAPAPLLLATRNRHKIREIGAILGDPFECRGLETLADAPELSEDADTFAGNAAAKATQLARWIVGNATLPWPSGGTRILGILADDSGLEVDALNGAPGVRSARFAADPGPAGNTPDRDNNAKLLRLLQAVPAAKRTARFRCVLALLLLRREPGGAWQIAPPRFFEGVCEGRIDRAPRGLAGFGYDPLFVPAGYAESFAELGESIKGEISHRGRALEKLRQACHSLFRVV